VVIKSLRLMVLTPAETLLDRAEVSWVQVQLSDGGGIGIYPGHAPLLAETVSAPLRYADELGEHTLDLAAGILQVEYDGVTIFTSGLAQTTEVPETSIVSDGARFDRLAGALLAALQVRPGEVSFLSEVKGLVLSPLTLLGINSVEGPVLSEVEGPVLSEVEGLDIDDEEE
jgi:F0F1-type ATP synthase epsilon subunit